MNLIHAQNILFALILSFALCVIAENLTEPTISIRIDDGSEKPELKDQNGNNKSNKIFWSWITITLSRTTIFEAIGATSSCRSFQLCYQSIDELSQSCSGLRSLSDHVFTVVVTVVYSRVY